MMKNAFFLILGLLSLCSGCSYSRVEPVPVFDFYGNNKEFPYVTQGSCVLLDLNDGTYLRVVYKSYYQKNNKNIKFTLDGVALFYENYRIAKIYSMQALDGTIDLNSGLMNLSRTGNSDEMTVGQFVANFKPNMARYSNESMITSVECTIFFKSKRFPKGFSAIVSHGIFLDFK